MLGQALAHGVQGGVALVARLHDFQLFLVFGGVEFGVFDHLLDFGFRQARVGLDGDGVFLAGAFVFGADVQDAVGVNVEGDFNLRQAARRGRNAFQIELAQQFVAAGHLALALEDFDGHGRLVVVGRGEGLRVLGRDGRVLGDHLGHHAAQGFDAQGKGRDVKQQHVFAAAGEHLALNGGAHGHGFVGVDVLARLLAEELFHLVLHFGHARLAAHEDDVVDFAHGNASVLDGDAAGFDGALDQVFHQGFELGARELDVQVLRAAGVCRDVGQVDVGGLAAGEFDLGFFGGFFQALKGQHVAFEIDALLFLEFANDVVDDALVEVFAAQEGVAVGGEHFKLLFAIDISDFDDGDVEGAAAQVIHGNAAVALFLLVQAKGQRGRRRLVDDALDFQPGDAACVLGGLALAVVEVGGHGDDGFRHRLAQVVLRRLFHLAQDFGADLLRREFLAAHFHPGIAVVGLDDLVGHQMDVFLHLFFVELAANQALDGVNGVFRIGDGLALGCRAHEDFAIVLVGHDGRRGARAFGVFNHLG